MQFVCYFAIMKQQHEIILSLGTNLGNKQENLQCCINEINDKIATVISVSSVYESEAWGFEADNFFNCNVLIHTEKSACLPRPTRASR